jgi:hypothetical protein
VSGIGERVEALLGRAAGNPDTEDLVAGLLELYGTGLARIVEALAKDAPAVLERLAADPHVEGLLLVHDLHPLDPEARVRRAVEPIDGAEFHGIDDDGVARIRLRANVSGFTTAMAAVRHDVERAVADAAPEIAGVVVETAAPQPLLQIGGRRAVTPDAERCELCGTPVEDRHGHLVDLETRGIACACRPCYLLFTAPGAGGDRYRGVPDRYLADHALSEGDWDELGIPVSPVFFFVNSALDRVVASYPSPAGATECELDLAAWHRLAAERPLLRALVPDVEALYVVRDATGPECYLVPIDACYGLVGRVRKAWRGLDGGAEVRQVLAGFRAELRDRARILEPEG